MTRFAIQHRTTKQYLALTPSLHVGHRETVDVDDAVSFDTRQQAEWEREDLGDFRDVYVIVPIGGADHMDTPSKAALERFDQAHDAPVFTVTRRVPGHAHTRIEGTYTGDATVGDVETEFFTVFGGRDVRVGNGEFSCVRHDD